MKKNHLLKGSTLRTKVFYCRITLIFQLFSFVAHRLACNLFLFPSLQLDFLSISCPSALSTFTYAGPAGHSTYDMAGDSMPLRYDSPMSPYASYYVYVPVSGVANSGITTPKLELADEETEGSRREDRSAAAQSREEPSGCEEYGE